MIIEVKEMGNTYTANMMDLPCYLSTGIGDTKDKAIAHLFFEIARPYRENWLQYIDFLKLEIVYA